MKKALLLHFVLLLSVVALSAQKKVYISENVLKVAAQAEFDYKDMVKKAAKKDGDALQKLFEFGRIVDGKEVNEHALTCLELIPLATDEVYANAVATRNVKLKTALRRWITQAQESTTNEELKKPLSEWAPYTWEALNNRELKLPSKDDATATPDAGQGSLKNELAKPADSTTPTPNNSTTPATTTTPTTTTPATTTPTTIDAGRAKTSPGKGN
jgi:hypothetical protein